MSNYRPGGVQDWPPVVKNLIIINVIMVIAQFSLFKTGIDLQDYLALHYWASPKFKIWQMVTHMFMHGAPEPEKLNLTVAHIFFNMFGLFMFGRILENLWGPKRFLIFYMICGLGAALCHMGVLTFEAVSFHNAFMHYQEHPGFVQFAQFVKHNGLSDNPNFADMVNFWSAHSDCGNCVSESVVRLNSYYSSFTDASMVGASGAVFGILFAFAYLFPNTELFLMFIPVPIKAKWAVAGYIAIELFSGFGKFSGDNVAHFAHLGGVLFAFILLRIWRKNVRNDFY
jgi:membrane associated rhomboid family serine protease